MFDNEDFELEPLNETETFHLGNDKEEAKNKKAVKDMTAEEININIDLMTDLYGDIEEMLKNPLLEHIEEVKQASRTLNLVKIKEAIKVSENLNNANADAVDILEEVREGLYKNMKLISNYKEKEGKSKIAFKSELEDGREYLKSTIFRNRLIASALIIVPIINLAAVGYIFYTFQEYLI